MRTASGTIESTIFRTDGRASEAGQPGPKPRNITSTANRGSANDFRRWTSAWTSTPLSCPSFLSPNSPMRAECMGGRGGSAMARARQAHRRGARESLRTEVDAGAVGGEDGAKHLPVDVAVLAERGGVDAGDGIEDLGGYLQVRCRA